MRRSFVVVLLGLVAGLSSSCGKKEKALERSEPPAPTFEAPPSWLPMEGPPAGRTPCGRDDANGAEEAARGCFARRIKPALLAVAKTKRLGEIDVGYRDSIERHLAFAEHIGCTETASLGEPKPQWSDEPKRTVLGDPTRVSQSRRYYHCSLTVSAPRTPADAGYYLGFYVDEQTFETVYVYHPSCC